MDRIKTYLKTGFLLLIFFLHSPSFAFAKELKIVFTGQAYASLYPCDCPLDSVGGMARRASAIALLRDESKDLLLVEAGSSFNKKDPNKENIELDRKRAAVYLDCLALMGYDAVLAGQGEFVFGLNFLKGHRKIPFITSNIKEFREPYIIKDYGWIKVGVIGFSDLINSEEMKLKWVAPSSVLKDVIAELKTKGVDFVVLLSELNPEEDKELLEKTKGIDVVINGTNFLGSVFLETVYDTLYLRTWWQARNVGVLTLRFQDRQLENKELNFIKLDRDLKDDKRVLNLLPACFQNSDCHSKAGSLVQCIDAGTKKAQCSYTQGPKVELIVIKPRFCRTCREDEVIVKLRQFFENFEVKDFLEDDKKAAEIIKEFDVKMLPAYVFNKDIATLERFEALKSLLVEGQNYYLLKPSESGVSYLMNRPKTPKRLDVFFDFSYNQTPELFKMLKSFKEKHPDYNIHLNFLVVRDKEGFYISRGGASEIEEFHRLACIDKLYHDYLFEYLICRSSQKGLSWWGDCALQSDIDTMQIKECVVSEAGRLAFNEHAVLSEELEIINGPTFVIDNKEIFSVVNMPTPEEFEKTVVGENQKNKK